MLAPRTDPITFARLHFRLTDARPLKHAGSAADASALIEGVLASIKIRRKVFAFSKIGNAVIEVYTPESEVESVKACLSKAGVPAIDLDILGSPDIATDTTASARNRHIVNRCSYLYRRASLQNLRTAILDGLPEELRAEVIAASLPRAGQMQLDDFSHGNPQC
jgi:hypothetical protein